MIARLKSHPIKVLFATLAILMARCAFAPRVPASGTPDPNMFSQPICRYSLMSDSATLTNPTAETTFNTSWTMDPNQLTPTTQILIKGGGKCSFGTPGALSVSLNISNTGMATPSMATATANSSYTYNDGRWDFEAMFTMRSDGASGTVNVGSVLTIPNGTGYTNGGTAESNAATIDTTVANNFNFDAKFGTSNGSNAITVTRMAIFIIH